MCGLFGLIRNQACDPSPASDTFLALGSLAEERGTHAGGLAMAMGERTAPRTGARTVRRTGPVPVPAPAGAPVGADAGAAGANGRPDVTGGGWRVVKGHGAFGGVCVSLLRDRFTLPEGEGDTDTEALLLALDQAAGAIEPTLEVLSAAVGRTALIWTDRRRPRTVMLARTALSPLAVAFDVHGNLYWASNPGWFARAARHSGSPIPAGRVRPLGEGTLLVAELAGGRPRLTRQYSFTPTARTLDEELAPRVAYLGFSDADKCADQELLRHRTVGDGTPAASCEGPMRLVP